MISQTLTRQHIEKVLKISQPSEYPERAKISPERVSWKLPFELYKPPYYVSPRVLANDSSKLPNGWADPENSPELARSRGSLIAALTFDEQERPLNPYGRTGLAGRGLLGKWGANFAVDVIATRKPEGSELIEVALIRRKDNGQWALPGGMVDKGETLQRAAQRELKEETNIETDLSLVKPVYQGIVLDPRMTDHAWIETSAFHKHFDSKDATLVGAAAGDDASAFAWCAITPQLWENLYASHADILKVALKTIT